ncbi:hypothetical protein AAH979_40295 [Plantactinospora sp. ZYX-F-223]|uniref:hypothetical protein n=1 Tax=Plantactinospora sp. ZYX-F-223 TaxID=3144103 RepID=UPI0031FCD659
MFFDTDADEPTPRDKRHWDEGKTAMIAVAEAAGVDPAFIHARREVGYTVTSENEHLFSATEVQAYLDAVARHQGVGVSMISSGAHPRSCTAMTVPVRRSLAPIWSVGVGCLGQSTTSATRVATSIGTITAATVRSTRRGVGGCAGPSVCSAPIAVSPLSGSSVTAG